MLLGCKLPLAMVSTSVRVRSSDRLPSLGTSVVVVVFVVMRVEVEVAEVLIGAFGLSPLAQAVIPTTRLMLMMKRFTPVRLCVYKLLVAERS